MGETEQQNFSKLFDSTVGECVHGCGRDPPGSEKAGNEICDDCLAIVRQRDAEADYQHYPDHLESINDS